MDNSLPFIPPALPSSTPTGRHASTVSTPDQAFILWAARQHTSCSQGRSRCVWWGLFVQTTCRFENGLGVGRRNADSRWTPLLLLSTERSRGTGQAPGLLGAGLGVTSLSQVLTQHRPCARCCAGHRGALRAKMSS